MANQIRKGANLKRVGDNEQRNTKRQLFMVEDFLANISIRTQQVVDSCCKLNNENYQFPVIPTEFDQPNFSIYQNALFNIEIIQRHMEYLLEVSTKLRQEKDDIQEELEESVRGKIKVEEYYNNVMIENVNITKRLRKMQRCNKDLEQQLEGDSEKHEEVKLQLANLELRNQELQEENQELLDKVENDLEEINKVTMKNKCLQNLVQKLKTTVKKKTEELKTRNEENSEIKVALNYLETNTCHCRIPIDIDGIIEENRRLWDAYNHLQMEYVSCEYEKDEFKKKLDQENEKNKVSKEEIKSNLKKSILSKSKEKLLRPIDTKDRKASTLLTPNLKKSILTKSKEKLVKQTEDLESLKDKITQLVTYINENDTQSKKTQLDYSNLEEKLLNTQEMLLEYKTSFQQMEDLLDNKREEYEEKLSVLTKALEDESEENHILKNLLSNSLIKALVGVHVKMDDYEELLSQDFDTTDALCLDFLQKIEDLRDICEDEIIKIVEAVDEELEEYRRVIGQMEKVDVEEFIMVVKETIY